MRFLRLRQPARQAQHLISKATWFVVKIDFSQNKKRPTGRFFIVCSTVGPFLLSSVQISYVLSCADPSSKIPPFSISFLNLHHMPRVLVKARAAPLPPARVCHRQKLPRKHQKAHSFLFCSHRLARSSAFLLLGNMIQLLFH